MKFHGPTSSLPEKYIGEMSVFRALAKCQLAKYLHFFLPLSADCCHEWSPLPSIQIMLNVLHTVICVKSVHVTSGLPDNE